MIISASRRTDIPAFFSKWFERRIQEGFVYIRNPFNPEQLSKIDLSPDVIDCIVFWTKNPIPMLKRLDSFSDYPFYFQFTLTGYGKDIEANLPDKNEKLIPAFKELSSTIGAEKVIWRYDPIVFTEKYSVDYHLRAIEKIATELENHTEKCVISFVDTYRKNENAMEQIGAYFLDDKELTSFAKQIANIAGEHDIEVATCAEAIDLEEAGIKHNCCIDPELIGRIAGGKMKVGKDKSQRLECGCCASIDIGTYNTCDNGCKYCYANFDQATVKGNLASYDWQSPILCDTVRDDDVVKERDMKSLLLKTFSLFDED